MSGYPSVEWWEALVELRRLEAKKDLAFTVVERTGRGGSVQELQEWIAREFYELTVAVDRQAQRLNAIGEGETI